MENLNYLPFPQRLPGKLIEQDIHVRYRYRVYFTSQCFLPDDPLFKEILVGDDEDLPKKVLCIIDEGLSGAYPGLSEAVTAYCRFHAGNLALWGQPLIVPGGERAKNDPAYVARMQEAMHEAGLCRHSYVLVIGGGAVIDAAGYAAGTVHRGLRLIRMPTTVLSQADAGLGVKNGINAFGQKNFIGTFAPPWAVINDSSFLFSLPDRDWRSGVAEAIKVALIRDEAFFDFIESGVQAIRQRDMAVMQAIIHRCAALHLHHLATGGDPFESGNSRPLDFGHWSAHKLEQISGCRLRHGEAVALGIALDATYSFLAGLLESRQWRRILHTLTGLGFRLYCPELGRSSEILQGLKDFREHLGGNLTIMLLAAIGEGREVHVMEQELIVRAIGQLRAVDAGEIL